MIYPAINPKACEDEDDMSDQKGPYACLKKREGQTYCGRSFDESREFVFNDGPHAMRHYRRNSSIVLCEKCAKRAEDAGVGSGQYIAPMATRDLKENNR